ncbi:MAG TPA: hypothetical protein VF613_00635 [Longimicrobium sp.]|jgi:hypothetical protein
MPFIPHGRALGALPPDQMVLFLLALCVVVAVGSVVAHARCRRQEREFAEHLQRALRRG